MLIRNISRFGDLDVPLLGTVVTAGQEVAVSPVHAARLLTQPDIWQPVDDEATAVVAELAAPEHETEPDPGAETDDDPDGAIADDTEE